MRAVLLLGIVLVLGLAGGWLAGRGYPSPAPVAAPDPATALANGPWLCAPGVTHLDSLTLRAERNLYTGCPASNPDGTVNVVVETPAGTNAKWEVNPEGMMTLEVRAGAPRSVKYPDGQF